MEFQKYLIEKVDCVVKLFVQEVHLDPQSNSVFSTGS